MATTSADATKSTTNGHLASATTPPQARVHEFGPARTTGDGSMRLALGGKGADLCEMSRLGLPVPPGLVVATGVCREYLECGRRLPDGLMDEVRDALGRVAESVGRTFGGGPEPLLVSVRSGGPVSMPGMMDTVLNLGLNSDVATLLAESTGSVRFALDAHRRFLAMFGHVVLGVDGASFDAVMGQARERVGVASDAELGEEDLRAVIAAYRDLVAPAGGVPDDPVEQLTRAIAAVFDSWTNERAVVYRRHHGIPETWGTAVTVQAMVFGNAGEGSGSGVAFTRNPATGEAELFGEYLPMAQGEDVVAGVRTPLPVSTPLDDAAAGDADQSDGPSLQQAQPDVYDDLVTVASRLEGHFRDAQDVEFTIERGKLWMLQTRSAKRTAHAAIRMATDMVDEGLITPHEAVTRVDAGSLPQLFAPSFAPDAPRDVLGRGLPASPGAASGRIALDAATSVGMAPDGPVLLVRDETSPDDIAGMLAAAGMLTARGGMTSHAAVVARGIGRPCVSGCRAVSIDIDARRVRIGDTELSEGDWLSLDGTTGEVIAGRMPTVPATADPGLERVLAWADEVRTLGVLANADTPADAAAAHEAGAAGVGLCRTEHMFFAPERLAAFTRLVLADDDAARQEALAALLPAQRNDFVGILRAMDGLPVTIRLLDPPLHEFLPADEERQAAVARELGVEPAVIERRVHELREANPMLGHRGVRLGITHPEITRMQARAVAEATQMLLDEGRSPQPHVMVPLVATERELEVMRELVQHELDAVLGGRHTVPIGTMIEVPRACVIADRIAAHADFLSFGTNDLTQMTMGLSRDDIAGFLPAYLDRHVLEADPFATIDVDGVGALMAMAIERARGAKDSIPIGLCGEHGGDPASIAFLATLGLDYVSCSPRRVRVARLAAAQAAVKAARDGSAAAND